MGPFSVAHAQSLSKEDKEALKAQEKKDKQLAKDAAKVSDAGLVSS